MKATTHRFIKAILRQSVDRTPVWIMRQAGRYLPEYCALRRKAGSFLALCKTPELACEVTLQPLARFDLDAAIIFSDILTIPDAMGAGLYFVEGEGPKFHHPPETIADIMALKPPDPMALHYVYEAIALCRRELNNKLPLIGFSGSPWTVACYLLEGGGGRPFKKAEALLAEQPKVLAGLLQKLTFAITDYLNAQIKAGVQALMIFDTWGGLLNTADYQTFSLHYMTEIVTHLMRVQEEQKIPVILFTKGGGRWLENMADSGCDAISLDATVNLRLAREQVGNKVALQGNMDPAILHESDTRIREEVATLLQLYGPGTGHVFNLGHGISKDTSPDKVKWFVNTVHELSLPFH